jgi:MATE family multidrug resistance protein
MPLSAEHQPRPGGLREVATLAYPVVLTQISITTMHLVDSAMVGRLGPSELAAVGFGGVWIWTALCFFIGTTNSVQTFVSQDFGAERHDRCGFWAWQGLWAAVPMVAIGVGTLLLFLEPLLQWLAPSDLMRPLAQSYMSQRLLGSVGLTAATVYSCFFRGLGDTRTPMYATILANLVNVVFDYGLIFGRLGMPEWGVAGAGTATALGEWVYFFALLWAFHRREVHHRYATGLAPVDRGAIRRLLRTGFPIGGQWMLEMLSFAVFLTLVARMGDAPMAASQIFIALLSISFMQAIGLSIGVSTLVGRYIGAERPDAVTASFRSGLKLASLLAGLIALLFAAFPELLLRIFTNDPQVLELGRPLLRIGALYQAFDAFGIVADGALRGAGDTRVPFGVRFFLAWGLFLPLAYILGITLDGGLTAAWAAGVVYGVVLAGFLVWRFHSGAWKRIQI